MKAVADAMYVHIPMRPAGFRTCCITRWKDMALL